LTNGDFIFFEGLLFLILFHIIGHPIVNIVLRRPGVPNQLADLDFIQKLPLEFITGGAVIYAVALLATPFHGFTALVCWVIIGVAATFYLYQHLKGLASFKKPYKYSWVALACFVLALAIRVGPVSNFVLGSNQDITWHTLLTYSVMRNGGIPFSVLEGFVLQVPVGVHTNFAFFSFISGIPPELVAFNMLVFLGALIGLAAYLFGSIISSRKFGLYVSLIMITFSLYPSAITWGSDWLLLGLLIFFVASSLVVTFSLENLQLNRSGILSALFPGLITGFLAATYIPLYIILIVTSILMGLLGRKDILQRLRGLAIIFMLGAPLFAVWVYRYFFVFQPNPPFIAQQAADMAYYAAIRPATLFLPIRDFLSPIVLINTVGNWLTWDFQSGWPGAFAFFPLLVSGVILLFHYLLSHKIKIFDYLFPRYIVSVILLILLWGLNGPLGLFHVTSFGLGIMMTELDKIAPIMGTIFLPFIAAYALTTVDDFVSKKTKAHARATKTVSACVILFVVSTSVALVPLTDAWLVSNYKIFATATESDYQLLKWMHSNIPSNSSVLVNPEDAGQYVPSIGGQKAIFVASTGIKFLTQEYKELYTHIRDQVFNLTTVKLLRDLRIDYVFMGARAFAVGGWDAIYFLRNPWYFRLVYNVSSSYLFAVVTSNYDNIPVSINRIGYLGFSSNQTSIDFKHMMMQDLATSESVFLEIDLKDRAGNVLECINYWNPPKLIISPEINLGTKTDFTLVGSTYSFNLTMSSTDNGGIGIYLYAEYPPPQSSVFISFFPIYEVKQSKLQYTTDKIDSMLLSARYPVQGIPQNGTTYLELVPIAQQVIATSRYYLYVQSHEPLNITIRTGPVN
jgi:hypothetical protein